MSSLCMESYAELTCLVSHSFISSGNEVEEDSDDKVNKRVLACICDANVGGYRYKYSVLEPLLISL